MSNNRIAPLIDAMSFHSSSGWLHNVNVAITALD
jgi:hypothetical protein